MDTIDLINDDIPAYKKKSKKKGQPRADHKHMYETVLLITHYHINVGKPSISDHIMPTKVCTICGRIDYIDEDESMYKVHPDPDVKHWMIWRRELSDKALGLPKWQVDAFEKFAIKAEE